MKKLINFFWKPEKQTVLGFTIWSYIIFAPALLLFIILPGNFVLGILILFFMLKSVIMIRAAATITIEKEKLEKCSGSSSVTKIAYANLLFCVIAIVFFYLEIGGTRALLIGILIAFIALPNFIVAIITIKRCQKEQGQVDIT